MIVTIYGFVEEVWGSVKILLTKLTHFKKRNRIRRYGLPLVLIGLIFLIKHYFHSILGSNSAFLMVSFVVVVSSWYGGLGPGFFSTFLSALLVYFTFLTEDTVHHPFIGDMVVIIIFIAEGSIISLASEARFEVEEQKDEFIGFLAHELKNPLAAIVGFSGLIINTAKNNGNSRIRHYGEQISVQSGMILDLINDLLDITKIEIGRFTYTDSFFDIAYLAKEVIDHQKIIMNNRIIEFHNSLQRANILYGDRYRIGQVIINLITNALKYSPQTKKVIIRLAQKKGVVILSIQDFGLGIAIRDQKKIFSRFYRADMVQRNRSDGLGLGLYICNQIAQHHKAELKVKSKEGKGSTFYFIIPKRSIKQRKIGTYII